MNELQVKAFRNVLKYLLKNHLYTITNMYLEDNTKEDLEIVLSELGISSNHLY